MKLVLVEWVDSGSNSDWQTKNDDMELAHCTSVGILRKETPELIELCLCLSGDLKSSCMVMPQVCIKRIRKLGVKR